MIFNLSSNSEYMEAMSLIKRERTIGSRIEITKKQRTRSQSQNRSMHLMFTQIANEFNDHGLYIAKVLKPSVDVEWTPSTVKELIWRPLMKAITDKDSTAKLNTAEVDKIFKVLHKHLADKLNISIEFPSVESLVNNGK
jgi:hypothetical protein